MILRINAKCSDLFSAVLEDNEGNYAGEYDGYVPDFFPSQHFGDYVELTIDTDTGRILNWKRPTKAQLRIFKREQ